VPPIKLLYVMDYYYGPLGGTEGQLLELVRGLDRTRFDPRLVVFRPTAYLAAPSAFPCPVEHVPVTGIRRPCGWFRLAGLARRMRQQGVRLVHTYFNDASILMPPFARLAGAKTIVSRRDMGFWYTKGALRALRVSARFVDAVVANSEAVRQNVHQHEGYPLDRISVLYNGHDPSRFDAAPLEGFRESLGIGPLDPIIGMVANLNRVKHHPDLLKAFSLLRHVHPNAHLVLVGQGRFEPTVRETTAALGLASCVHILGGRADVVALIKHFDVCVLCSESEGFSNTVMEYMGAGRATVCTNVGGNPELVRHGENGFLVPPHDPAHLARQMADILARPALAREVGARARQTVVERFTSRRMVERHMELYEHLLAHDVARGDVMAREYC
jgi:L-malate glycosyltransferase